MKRNIKSKYCYRSFGTLTSWKVADAGQTRKLVRDLQLFAKESGHKRPLLIGIDQENGTYTYLIIWLRIAYSCRVGFSIYRRNSIVGKVNMTGSINLHWCKSTVPVPWRLLLQALQNLRKRLLLARQKKWEWRELTGYTALLQMWTLIPEIPWLVRWIRSYEGECSPDGKESIGVRSFGDGEAVVNV